MKNETTAVTSPAERNNAQKQNVPSIEQWMKEAKQQPDADQCGMYLFHNGWYGALPKHRCAMARTRRG